MHIYKYTSDEAWIFINWHLKLYTLINATGMNSIQINHSFIMISIEPCSPWNFNISFQEYKTGFTIHRVFLFNERSSGKKVVGEVAFRGRDRRKSFRGPGTTLRTDRASIFRSVESRPREKLRAVPNARSLTCCQRTSTRRTIHPRFRALFSRQLTIGCSYFLWTATSFSSLP